MEDADCRNIEPKVEWDEPMEKELIDMRVAVRSIGEITLKFFLNPRFGERFVSFRPRLCSHILARSLPPASP